MVIVSELVERIKQRYEGLIVKDSYKEIAFFFNPEKKLKNGVYVCTIKEDDGPNDKASELYRKDVYRLSCGPEKSLYKAFFGDNPKRALKGETVDVPFNFNEVNVIMPHPVYAWMCWVCVNSPDESTLDDFFKLVDSSYEKAKKSYNDRMRHTEKEKN